LEGSTGHLGTIGNDGSRNDGFHESFTFGRNPESFETATDSIDEAETSGRVSYIRVDLSD